MIRDLDQIASRQHGALRQQPQWFSPGEALIAEGDPAVEPLLAALESDTRLTRTVTYGRGMSIDRFVPPVFEAELAALTGILKTPSSGARTSRVRHALAEGAGAVDARLLDEGPRVSLNERWYRMLSDDSAGRPLVGGRRRIIQPSDPVGPAVQGLIRRPVGRNADEGRRAEVPSRSERLGTARAPRR